MTLHDSRSREEIEADLKAIEAAIQAAVRDALIEHKLLGQPIVVADENDNVVWVPAEQIEIPEVPSGLGARVGDYARTLRKE